MKDKIKIKVSLFVVNILENDALRFGFKKNDTANKNALLNKLIPTLVEVRKARRSEIENILKTNTIEQIVKKYITLSTQLSIGYILMMKNWICWTNIFGLDHQEKRWLLTMKLKQVKLI